jgi:hypothetical protein
MMEGVFLNSGRGLSKVPISHAPVMRAVRLAFLGVLSLDTPLLSDIVSSYSTPRKKNKNFAVCLGYRPGMSFPRS